jgi:hypothetical protein
VTTVLLHLATFIGSIVNHPTTSSASCTFLVESGTTLILIVATVAVGSTAAFPFPPLPLMLASISTATIGLLVMKGHT